LKLSEAQREIEKLIELGEPFERVETTIERLDRPEDEKAALWLLAWSTEERDVQRRVAKEALASVEDGSDGGTGSA
jgi:HPt (histidine-containing phosphotransfer) domain-containing protein